MKLGTIGEWLLVVIMGCIIAGTVIAFSFGQEPELGKWGKMNNTLWEKNGHGNETAFVKIHPGYVRIYLYFD